MRHPKFDTNREYLIETRPNTSMFEVQIKIPREVDGKAIHIRDEYEIRYIDRTTSNTNEKIVLKGKIGLSGFDRSVLSKFSIT